MALAIIAFTPQIIAWRLSIVDRLVDQAKNTQNTQQKLSYLEQAKMMVGSDPVATEALARFWLSRGETGRAIAVYQSVDDPNYLRLGNLALQVQDYNKALVYYKRAGRVHQSAESLSGEAVALYNTDKISEGCEKSAQASKQSLESIIAKNANSSCILLGGTQADATSLVTKSALSQRESAYFLIDNQVYKSGEKLLKEVESKSTTDFLTLARLSASRGELKEAIVFAVQGTKIDQSNSALQSTLVRLYTLVNDPQAAKHHAELLEQLKFSHY